jgi:hypothetical protein
MARINKIKNKVKKILHKTKAAFTRKPKRKPPARQLITPQEQLYESHKTVIERAKFSTPQVAKYSRQMRQELPHGYEKDKIALQVRDPWWLYTYWEVTGGTYERLRQRLKEVFMSAKRILRVYDVSQINFNGSNAHRYFDIEINHEAQSWYIDTGGPGRSWCVDFGLKLPSGEFITIVRSNVVHTPIEGPSWITDEEWMVPEEMFGRLYGMGFGLGQSSPVGKAWQERVKKALFSGVLASPGITSMASPVKKMPKQRKFWMVVDCELIVYGATEPDATVYVQGKKIKLRPDGTFTLRYALPDGKQVIPVKGVSADQEEERNITPIVTRETK